MTQVPIDVWEIIAAVTPPNPFLYTSWSHVCRNSRVVFTRNSLWRKFCPDGEDDENLSMKFHEKLHTWPQDRMAVYRQLFIEMATAWAWDTAPSSAQVQLKLVPKIMKDRNALSEFYGRSIEFDLVCICWLHMVCTVWWPEQVRNDPIHALAIQKRNACFNDRKFVLCAASLYGPLLRYFPSRFLDDEEIVLRAANYFILGSPGNDRNMHEWIHWRTVTPFSVISERLKHNKRVVHAFIIRWPFLITEVPDSTAKEFAQG